MCNTECVLKGEGKHLGSEDEEALHRRLHTEGRERCGGDGWGRLMGKEGGKECRRVNDEGEEGDGGRDGVTKEKEKGKEFYSQEREDSSNGSVQPRGVWGLNSNLHKTIQANLIFSLTILIY